MKRISILIAALTLVSQVYAKPNLPYYASESRQKEIIEGYGEIVIGMTSSQVESVLGKPDDITPLYEPNIMKKIQIGTTYWYLIQQLKEYGSVIEIGRKGVGVRTDLKGKVTRIDTFDLP
jgi:hypothetical protein